jgi:alpha-ribazole phosphatase
VVLTSPLQRTAAVGRCLARWGWQHIEDPRLAELDFGRWDGLSWDRIGTAALDAWTADFSRHAPGGGESLTELFARCQRFLGDAGIEQPACIVGHAGWISAARHVVEGRAPPAQAADWPRPARHAQMLRISTRQEQLS